MDQNQTNTYKIKDTYPPIAFSPGEQKRLADQISAALTHTGAGDADKK